MDFYSKLERDDSIILSELCCNNTKVFNEVFENPEDIENVYLENGEAEDNEFTEELLALDNFVSGYFKVSNSHDSKESCFLTTFSMAWIVEMALQSPVSEVSLKFELL